ncbi:hypothetical protein B0H15DRAFT_507937 [Mycena belliarum]|uniref:Uncharacterized protein n=1 Tax=Mycena belliarum TaxID=1033014 RepID=A0AAD6UDU1_9AGAR|nr:hypothetical protein B0H15DRAFT_507937 [Mycena belliae]
MDWRHPRKTTLHSSNFPFVGIVLFNPALGCRHVRTPWHSIFNHCSNACLDWNKLSRVHVCLGDMSHGNVQIGTNAVYSAFRNGSMQIGPRTQTVHRNSFPLRTDCELSACRVRRATVGTIALHISEIYKQSVLGSSRAARKSILKLKPHMAPLQADPKRDSIYAHSVFRRAQHFLSIDLVLYVLGRLSPILLPSGRLQFACSLSSLCIPCT